MTPRAPLGGPAGLCQQLRQVTQRLIDSSHALSRALLGRHVEATWEILAQQEQLAGQFSELMRLWQTLFAAPEGMRLPATVEAQRELLRQEIGKLQRVSRENAALARGFVGAIGRTLDGLGKQSATKAGVYNRLGQVNRARTSMLVSQMG